MPADTIVTIRLYDAQWHLLVETTTFLRGEVGKAGTFRGEITVRDYSGPAVLALEHAGTGANSTMHLTIQAP
jgi:hypothetical protein